MRSESSKIVFLEGNLLTNSLHLAASNDSVVLTTNGMDEDGEADAQRWREEERERRERERDPRFPEKSIEIL